MIQKICLFSLGLTLSLFVGLPQLQAQTIDGNDADAAARTNTAGPQGGGTFGLQNLNAPQVRVGRFTTGDGISVTAVYVFELPDLGLVADPFTTADLEFTFLALDPVAAAPDYNADLFGIDARPLPDVDATIDFFAGPGPDPDATSLQEDILTPTTDFGRINSVDIAAYLNAQYDGGAGIGQFVFLRFSPDYDPGTIIDDRDGYLIAANNNADTALRAVINFTTGGSVLLGDVNLSTTVDFADIAPFISLLSTNMFQLEADIDMNGMVDFADIAPFIGILAGS